MHQTYRRVDGVDEINSATIGDINAEANTALICNQAITTLETFVHRDRLMANADTLSVHLLRCDERRAAESMCSSDFTMHAIQPSERLQFIVRHLDIRDAQGESVNDVGQRAERWELLSQKLTCVHLLEVAREECLVSTDLTGFLVPAPFNCNGDGFGPGVGKASTFGFRPLTGSSSSF